MAALSQEPLVAVLPERFRRLLEGRLPQGIEARWWSSPAELEALAPAAQIGWFDLFDKPPALRALASAAGLRWLNTAFAGVDWLPLADLDVRGVTLTNGSGLSAISVAEFTVLGMLAIARDYRAIVRAADRREWIKDERDVFELHGTRALVVGYGTIGQRIGSLLAAFGVEVVAVRSQAAEGVLGPDEWRSHIGSFKWIVLALPATADTSGLVGGAELAAMGPNAVLVNVGRAECIDQAALVDALAHGRIGGALLDLADPEPLPPDHPLWALPSAHITMHQAGVPNAATRRRAADRFVSNCERFVRAERLEGAVDLARGY
jgi:phosphoglycerate dehydrogenase-like enzyme